MKKLVFVLAVVLAGCSGSGEGNGTSMVDRPDTDATNSFYVSNRAPLVPQSFIKLPPGTITPEGWIGEILDRQRDGMTGHLGELSRWLEKDGNAWLGNGGNHGWEEVPYWLKGYGDLAYVLHDDKMVEETKIWIEAALASQREDGFFGPDNRSNGKPDLWPNMIMLWCLQSYYEYTEDARVLDFMANYFHWELTVPDEDFLEEYWGSSRAGDNIQSVIWLYNRTGDESVLPLIEKIHRNAQNWHQDSNLPNWHNVNISQCFREPAQYYSYSTDSSMLAATYNTFDLIRRTFGQVPGGMW
ncbi:MAG: glycoside hydrolase family 127 protein, partial [Bacteroidales bacterium]|nr:glycoside hydrolase family 127 protein [Bacteroidales bacterium]